MITQQRSNGPNNHHSQAKGDRTPKAMNNRASEIKVFSSGEEVDVECGGYYH